MHSSPALSSASRPKIHRLPVVPKLQRPPSRLAAFMITYGNTFKFTVAAGGVAIVLAFVALSASRLFPATLTHDIAPPATATTVNPTPADNTIVLRNENQVIIGQMARISSPAAPSSEVSTMSNDVDKRKGQELLSIVNQY